jgi:hypothetical protein
VAELRSLAAAAEIPERKALMDRLHEKDGALELISDGYGGLVDFNAAKGTVQDAATKRFAGGGSKPKIEWEFELARDTETIWNKSIVLTPKAGITNGGDEKKDEIPFFEIKIAKSNAGPFKAGDRVKLSASIDDFSRFGKDFGKARGLMAIYYYDDAPNPVFYLKLDEADVALVRLLD